MIVVTPNPPQVAERLARWLSKAVSAGAADLHLVPGYPPALRLHGELIELREPIRISVMPSESQAGLLLAEPMQLVAGQKETALIVRLANDAKLVGEQSVVVRASTLRNGYPVISETTVLLTVKPSP